MTPERIKALRKLCRRTGYQGNLVTTYPVEECLDEIERLQAELAKANAEIQRLRRLAREHLTARAMLAQWPYDDKRKAINEIGPIVEDKPYG